MSPAILIKEIEKLFIKGIKKAFNEYEKYTGVQWGLGHAPESFLQFQMAQFVGWAIGPPF